MARKPTGKPRKPTETVAVKVRLRESVRRMIQIEADKQRITVNKEIERRLQRSFTEQVIEDVIKRTALETANEATKTMAMQLNMVFALLGRPDLMVKIDGKPDTLAKP